MTIIKELRNVAKKDINIRGCSNMRKADLLRVLNTDPHAKTPTVKNLKKIAKKKNMKEYYKMKRTDLIVAVRRDDEILHEAFPLENSFF